MHSRPVPKHSTVYFASMQGHSKTPKSVEVRSFSFVCAHWKILVMFVYVNTGGSRDSAGAAGNPFPFPRPTNETVEAQATTKSPALKPRKGGCCTDRSTTGVLVITVSIVFTDGVSVENHGAPHPGLRPWRALSRSMTMECPIQVYDHGGPHPGLSENRDSIEGP